MVQEKRTITHVASVIIALLMILAFVFVWMSSYNHIVFRTHQEEGAIVCIFVWILLYIKFCKVYSAFKIASNSIGEMAFSQFLSIAFSDLLLYIAGCLIARAYINIWPGVLTVIIQSVLGVIWAAKSKQYFLNHVEPQKCLLLYESSISETNRMHGEIFIKKLQASYGHLFAIDKRIPVDDINQCYTLIDIYPIIFIYNMRVELRDKIIAHCISTGKRFYITPTLEDAIAIGYSVKHFIDTPIFSYNSSPNIVQSYFGKRLCDIIFSLLLLVIASPFMLVTAIAIKLEDHGPVFFKQKRVAAGGKVFNILKFRSMIVDAEKDGKSRPAVEGDPRITKVGKIIRKTRIDELPQLINVLKGDISIVGPRPERVEHVDLFTKQIPEFGYRLRVPAGLTGYAQVYGKYNTTPRDKLLLDLLYIEQQSFLMDAKIVFLTIKIMFTPESTEGFDLETSKEINEISNSSK